MKKLLNTLFVNREDAYASLDGENIVIKENNDIIGRFPLQILEAIYIFSYAGASPALMGKCADSGIDLVFCSPSGKFLARTSGESRGNVLLRRMQYSAADDPFQSCRLAKCFIFGKLNNARAVIDRAKRDHGLRVDADRLSSASDGIKSIQSMVLEAGSLEELRGYEGSGAGLYFDVLDELILRDKESFFFSGRNRRPPMDRFNAMLSFTYVMLSSGCASALEAVGLDAYVGFMHRDRPGRTSLAQDLMEELRPCLADRFVLTMINNRKISPDDFIEQEDGAVLLNEDGRKKIQREWWLRKNDMITHPFLKEKLEWGLVPYLQALLLARCLRGDIDEYPPFLWR